MSNSASIQVVRSIIRSEGNSVLQYLHGAYPWGTVRDESAIAALDAMIEEERGAIVGLICYLSQHHVASPHLGTFPTDFTTLNFIAFEYLLPRVIDYERKSEARLRDAIATVSDAEARERLAAFAELKKRHLEALERLKTQEPAAVA